MSEAIVYNATNEIQTIRMQGSFFTFKPKQMKLMTSEKAQFISENRKENGLVVLSADFLDTEFKDTEEGKAQLEAFTQQGIDNFVAFHRSIIRNNQVSLRKDLARANEKVDPAVEASKGEIHAMETVAQYQNQKADSEQKKVDRVKELMAAVGNSEK